MTTTPIRLRNITTGYAEVWSEDDILGTVKTHRLATCGEWSRENRTPVGGS